MKSSTTHEQKKYRKQHGIAKEQHKEKRSRRLVSILNRRGHESTNKKCGGKEKKNGKKEKEKMKKKKPSKLASRQAGKLFFSTSA